MILPALHFQNYHSKVQKIDLKIMYLCAWRQTNKPYFDSLSVRSEISLKVQEQTITRSSSESWHLLRKKQITASKFGTVARQVSNFETLVNQLNPTRFVQTPAMKRGVELEPHVATIYANVAKNGGVTVFPSGLIIYQNAQG